MIYGIYFKPIQRIVYVGQTFQGGRKRYYDHWRHAHSADRTDRLHTFMRQYSEDQFELQVLAEGDYSRAELNDLEAGYINKYQTLALNDNSDEDIYRLNTYSRTGVINYHPLPKAVDWYDNNKQFIQTFESIVQAETQTGVNCVNISHCCNYSQTKTTKGWFRFHGDDTALEDSYRPGVACPVARVDQFTLDVIEVYPSIQKAEKIFGVNQGLIGQVCRGERYAGGGYLWRYVGKPEPTLNPKLTKIKTGVAKVDVNTKQVLKKYLSTTDAAKDCGIAATGINHAAQAPLKKTSGGFYWIKPFDYRILLQQGEIYEED